MFGLSIEQQLIQALLSVATIAFVCYLINVLGNKVFHQEKEMSRVIKFRAWDGKEMYTPKSIDGATGKAHELWYCYEIQGELDDPVMQFTGLKDQNGVDIYEGDIIEYRQSLFNVRPEKWPTKTKVVEWNSLRGSWNIYETAAGEDNIKVIGNIYQMPI